MIYLDNAATTYPKPEKVYESMDLINRNGAVNAGRGSYRKAKQASVLIEETKDQLRSLVHADLDTPIVFSPSITIALNQIINGIEWRKGDVVYLSPFEHNAVVRPIHMIQEKYGVSVEIIPVVDGSQEIDLEKLKYLFSTNAPRAVFCTGMSNVTGYILPVNDIFDAAKKHEAITVLDTAQSLGVVDLDIRKASVDIVAFAGHKSLYGPLGIGGFINVSRLELKPFIAGGTGSDSLNPSMPDGMENKFEASSMNIIAIAGLNAALSELNVADSYQKEKWLTEYAVSSLSELPGIRLFIPRDQEKHLAVISFIIEGWKSDDVGKILDLDFDIAVRTGFHCAPLIHSFLHDENNAGTIRIGIGRYNTKADVDSLINAIKELEC